MILAMNETYMSKNYYKGMCYTTNEMKMCSVCLKATTNIKFCCCFTYNSSTHINMKVFLSYIPLFDSRKAHTKKGINNNRKKTNINEEIKEDTLSTC